jgi:glyoxylase-like metal-dependent hydrolase (beta-lactamase superfamily II)
VFSSEARNTPPHLRQCVNVMAQNAAASPIDLGHGIYQLPTDYPAICNAPLWTYLVSGSETFALVDPGIRSTMQTTLVGATTELGFAVDQADLVLATHGHPDHSGGQSSWAEVVPRARIAAPLEDVPWVESFDRQWTRFWNDYPGTLDLQNTREDLAALCVPEPRVDLMLRDGDSVGVNGRVLDVIETRGHTWGHCAYFDRESATVFTGDAVQGHGTRSSDGQDVFAPLYVDVGEARTGLRRLLDVPFDMLCPAHADPLARQDGLNFLEDSLAFIDEVDAMARDFIDEVRPDLLVTRELAVRIAHLVGTNPPVTPQTVATARAHLYSLSREGLLEAAWLPTSSQTTTTKNTTGRRSNSVRP